MHERAHLENLLNALDASPRSLRRDASGNWHVGGKHGQIFADGVGYLIVVDTNESSRRWSNVKARLSFCRLTQDGDDEGCFHLKRLPTPAEAEVIREALHVKRKRRYTPEQLAAKAALAASLSKVTTSGLSPARTFAEMGRP